MGIRILRFSAFGVYAKRLSVIGRKMMLFVMVKSKIMYYWLKKYMWKYLYCVNVFGMILRNVVILALNKAGAMDAKAAFARRSEEKNVWDMWVMNLFMILVEMIKFVMDVLLSLILNWFMVLKSLVCVNASVVEVIIVVRTSSRKVMNIMIVDVMSFMMSVCYVFDLMFKYCLFIVYSVMLNGKVWVFFCVMMLEFFNVFRVWRMCASLSLTLKMFLM